MDRVVSRTTLSGETVKYTYEGGVLHTITDEQDRVYECFDYLCRFSGCSGIVGKDKLRVAR